MSRLGQAILVSACALFLGGCATTMDKKATSVDWGKGSVVVMSVSMTNEYKPNYGPTSLGVILVQPNTNNRMAMVSEVAPGTNTTIINLQIAPGTYSVRRLLGHSRAILINGTIDFAVDAPFTVEPKTVVYLGHVDLVNKEKSDKNDQSSGAAIPLIDQAVTGFGSGALAVAMRDDYERDVAQFKSEYPAMQGLDVVRAPLKKMTLERATGSSASVIVISAVSKVSEMELAK